jgi:hypothetical protein
MGLYCMIRFMSGGHQNRLFLHYDIVTAQARLGVDITNLYYIQYQNRLFLQ